MFWCSAFARVLSAACVLGGAIAGAPVAASTYSVDFSGISEGVYLDGAETLATGLTADVSSRRARDGATGVARVCDTLNANGCAGNDPDLASPFTEVNGLGSVSLGNVLILQSESTGAVNDAARGGAFSFSDFVYDAPGLLVLDRIDFADTADNRGGAQLFLNGSDTPWANADGKTVFGGGDNAFERVFVGEIVSSFSVTFGGSGALDNIELSTTPVPLPLTGLLLLAGVGAIGAAGRRRAG